MSARYRSCPLSLIIDDFRSFRRHHQLNFDALQTLTPPPPDTTPLRRPPQETLFVSYLFAFRIVCAREHWATLQHPIHLLFSDRNAHRRTVPPSISSACEEAGRGALASTSPISSSHLPPICEIALPSSRIWFFSLFTIYLRILCCLQ